MARINVFEYADAEDRAYGVEDKNVGWFYPESATRYAEDTRWDGNNNVSVNPVGPFGHQALYRTAGGRWVLNTWSQYQGVAERYEFVTDERARQWLILNNEDDAIVQWFGPLEEESGPSKGGRPAIGPEISVAYPRDLLDRIDAAAKETGVSRSEWIRRAAESALQAAVSP